ncbi:MAG TPA: hypothetical protein VIG99_10650 [Myxococcaceae bacterium]|jgi:hypothetical protein
MKPGIAVGFTLGALLLACPAPPEVKHRAELRSAGGSTIQVIPAADQLPYCLVFTISEGKVVRQLTMNRDNKSVKCEANQPIGNVSFRVPKEEGKVKVLVFFSDRKLQAGSLAQQIYELAAEGKPFYPYDLRLAGDVKIETLEFEPTEEMPTVSGEAVQPGATAATPADTGGGGTPPPGGGPGGINGDAGAPPPAGPPRGMDGGR